MMFQKRFGQCVPHNKDPNSFVWHVRPANTADTTTRSNTNDEIPWHTDCAFEIDPPEYQALFVVEPDNLGGGQLQIVRVNDVIQFLSAESIKALMTEKFKFKIKREYQKFDDIDYLEAPILFEQKLLQELLPIRI
ncbi:hypothetical protein I4U23_016324 [Adineta vaga]|nr:hypothetical protein I4U23_016324 [Adineta vaga]